MHAGRNELTFQRAIGWMGSLASDLDQAVERKINTTQEMTISCVMKKEGLCLGNVMHCEMHVKVDGALEFSYGPGRLRSIYLVIPCSLLHVWALALVLISAILMST